LFDFYNACYNYRWKLKRSPKSGFFGDRIPKRFSGKKPSQQVDQIVRLMFSYGNLVSPY